MRVKAPKTVLAFSSTSDAMAMEAAARERGIPGRIIPLPAQIDAGCGLAWCADAGDREALIAAVEKAGLRYEAAFEVMMY